MAFLREFEPVTSVRMPYRQRDFEEKAREIELLRVQVANRDDKILVLENDMRVLGWQVDEARQVVEQANREVEAVKSKLGYRVHEWIETRTQRIASKLRPR